MAYSYYASITIDNTKVSGSSNLTNFPVLISGTYDGTDGEPDIRTAANGGNVQNTASGGASGSYTVPADLVFSPNTDGSSPHDFEIEKYDASTGEIVAWVEIPTLAYDADTVLYMVFGDSGVTTSQEDVAGTWDGYDAVWHMGNVNDSTGNGNNFTNNGSIPFSSSYAKFGGYGAYITGNDYFKLAQASQTGFDGSAARTIIHYQYVVTSTAMYNWGFVHDNTSLIFQNNNDDDLRWRVYDSSGGGNTQIQGGNMSATGTWYFIACKVDASGNMKTWVDTTTDTASATTTLDNPGADIAVGAYPAGTPSLYTTDMYIDELRYSSSARSDDWITTVYNGLSSPSTFYTMGSEVAASLSVTYTLLATYTIDNTKVSGSSNITDLPVLLDENAFSSNVWANVDNGGGDLRFSSDEAGSSQLACHVVEFDTTAETAVVWVLTTLDYNDDTVIYIWGDNTGDSQPAASNTYGSESVYPSAFKGVYNFENNANDATSNATNGTVNNSPSYTSQKIGLGLSFNGTNQNVSFTSNWGLGTSSHTVLLWANIGASEQGAFWKVGTAGTGAANNGWGFGIGDGTYNDSANSGNEFLALKDGVAWVDRNITAGTGDIMFTGILDSGGGVDFYRNGSLDDSADATSAPNSPSSAGYIGGNTGAAAQDRYIAADICLVWVINEVKSADWLLTAYNNQNAVGTFGTAAEYVTPAGDTTVTGFMRGNKFWGI